MSYSYHKGQRLSYDGNLCTVRYLGPVQGTKGEWLGVEWDDPARGKHNGQHGDVRYFDCSSGSHTAASFVRPTRAHDSPRSFVEAIRSKYASEDLDEATLLRITADEIITISGKDVEEVGFDKIRRQIADLHALRIVVLDGLRIGRKTLQADNQQNHDENYLAGSMLQIAKGVAETCPNVVDLDLGHNLFESWQDIVEIISQLRKLSSLNIAGNKLSNLDVENRNDLRAQVPFSRLTSLNLEHCLLSYEEIVTVASFFPGLQSISLGSNELRKISKAPMPSLITHISLDQNSFEFLSQLGPLSKLENLQSLNLKGNRIRAVYDSTPREDHDERVRLVFPESLQDLDLSYNDISSWQSIDELASVFPGMLSLRTSANPLYEGEGVAKSAKEIADEGYILTIARLGKLDTLNYSRITSKARLDAEAFYLSRIGKELSTGPPGKAPEIISRHARYKELCERFGEPVVTRTQSSEINQNSLAARLVRCRFEISGAVIEAASVSSKLIEGKNWEIEIPESFTVYNVLGMAGKRFGLFPMLLRLVWETEEEELHLENEGNWDCPSTDQAESRQNLREEILEPRTRRIGTWFENRAAKIRIELSEVDLIRREAARTALLSY